MNDSAPRPPRDPLSSTLQTWRHDPDPAPDFNSTVWARIQSTESAAFAPPSTGPFARIFRFPFPSAFPLAASIALLASLAIGSGGAFALSRTRTTERMAVAYVRSIDPVQMTAPNGAHASHLHP